MTDVKKTDWGFILALALFAAVVILIEPWGNFPLDDDWAYSLTVKNFLQTGKLKLVEWGSPTLVWHVLWGGFFAKVFGFSHTVLRFSTILLSLGLIAFLKIYRGNGEKNSLLSPELMLLANPLFLILSLTFMTDAPYLAWFMLSAVFYFKAYETDNTAFWLLGSLTAALAYLIRQTGMFIPLGVLVFLLAKRGLTVRKFLLIAVIPALVICSHLYWFYNIHGTTWAQEYYVVFATREYISRPLDFLLTSYLRVMAMFSYMALFTLPFLIKAGLKKPSDKAVLITGALLLPFILIMGIMPYFPAVINGRGFGQITVGFIAEVGFKKAGVMGSPFFWIFATFLASSALIMWTAHLKKLKEIFFSDRVFLLGIMSCIQFGAALIGPGFFDRYFMSMIPLSLLIAHKASEGGQTKFCFKILASVAAGFMFALTFAGAQDYFSWNTAKWRAGRIAQYVFNIQPEKLYSGFDWTANYVFENNMAELKKIKPLNKIIGDSWLEPSPFSGYTSFAVFPYVTLQKNSEPMDFVFAVPYKTLLSLRESGVVAVYRKREGYFQIPNKRF
ncbi:MAG: glycosyltransferase family 39 protein [Elusimicrobia bacterium]|nr:glycosyltransferase family 39 protein [Elusimicrobiota bacterium]